MPIKKSLKYPIVTWAHHPTLRAVSKPIATISKEHKAFAKELLEHMRAYDGVGLAAPQLGKNIRIIATTQRVKVGKELKFVDEHVMFNPVITHKSEKMIIEKEACLSLPNMEGRVLRHEEVKVQYTDLEGKKKLKKFKWFDAVVVQHEVDHLDGVLFIDKMID